MNVSQSGSSCKLNDVYFFYAERPSTSLFRTPSNHSAGSDSGNEDDVESEPNNKV